jgi:ferrochelatase
MAPAFVSDCIETLEEVGIGLAETFEAAGGERLDAVPCLNADEAFLDALASLIRRELGGWVEAPPSA